MSSIAASDAGVLARVTEKDAALRSWLSCGSATAPTPSMLLS
jgi:hypothetical protein